MCTKLVVFTLFLDRSFSKSKCAVNTHATETQKQLLESQEAKDIHSFGA